MSELVAQKETVSQMEARHEAEKEELEKQIQVLLKSSNKKNRAQNESTSIQMRFDLKSKHIDEEDELEDDDDVVDDVAIDKLSLQLVEEEKMKKDQEEEEKKKQEEAVQKKINKSKKKLDKRNAKEQSKTVSVPLPSIPSPSIKPRHHH